MYVTATTLDMDARVFLGNVFEIFTEARRQLLANHLARDRIVESIVARRECENKLLTF